ncbi:GNAT family N-acetyltransferase [Psychromonas sp. PT13]|uniref:GNAT family N-acetyltransferase n=1 Tax=Psychromonas sp. PT13 TaxID=3439547 RepID=UPI003EBB5F8F
MQIREAKLQDLDSLSTLFHTYRHLSVSLNGVSTVQESKNWLEERLKNNEAAFLIAIKNSDMLGFATLYQGFSSISLKKYWVLNDLYVLDSARGLGIGSKLLGAVDSYVISTNAKGVELETSIDNVSAQNLYERLGYVENSQYKNYFKSNEL